MTPACMEYVRSAIERFPLSGPVLEIGSYNVNGSVRELFSAKTRFQDYVGMDMRAGAGVDYVCSTEYPEIEWAHPNVQRCGAFSKFSVIVSTEMLEHDRYFWKTLDSCSKVLSEGGHIVITTRNICFPRHDYPSDYYRFTSDGLRAVLEWAGFTVLEAIDDPADQGTFATGQKMS